MKSKRKAFVRKIIRHNSPKVSKPIVRPQSKNVIKGLSMKELKERRAENMKKFDKLMMYIKALENKAYSINQRLAALPNNLDTRVLRESLLYEVNRTYEELKELRERKRVATQNFSQTETEWLDRTYPIETRI